MTRKKRSDGAKYSAKPRFQGIGRPLGHQVPPDPFAGDADHPGHPNRIARIPALGYQQATQSFEFLNVNRIIAAAFVLIQRVNLMGRVRRGGEQSLLPVFPIFI